MRQLRIAAALLLAAAAHAQDTALEARARAYVRDAFGPGAWLRSGAGAGFNQLREHPREWGGGGDGFARRFGSGFGQNAVKGALQFGVGALRREAPGYVPSERRGVWQRTRYALRNTLFTSREGREGRYLAAGRLAGDFGAGMISRLWQPRAMRTVDSGLASGAISLGLDAAMNAFREFWPDVRRKLRGR